MSVQIAVRLDERVLDHIDSEVSKGNARSRAVYINRIVERELRRQQALQDLEKIRAQGPDPDAQAIARYNAAHPTPTDELDS